MSTESPNTFIRAKIFSKTTGILFELFPVSSMHKEAETKQLARRQD